MHIDELIAMDRSAPHRIAVIGDAMIDVWVHGYQDTGQEGCPRFRQHRIVRTPGGAANAARQLWRWHSEAYLIAPWRPPATFTEDASFEAFSQLDETLILDRDVVAMPTKTRFVQDGRVVFRHDSEPHCYGMTEADAHEARRLALLALKSMNFDAILVCDYDKGFLTEGMLRSICGIGREMQVPVLVDAKKHPSYYPGMILQCNAAYANRHMDYLHKTERTAVITRGSLEPIFCRFNQKDDLMPFLIGNDHCTNHVGAGDCFAAHLALILAHYADMPSVLAMPHAAGQVYVGSENARPPWPHEIRRQLTGDKVFHGSLVDLGELAASLSDQRVIVANGVFRLPHAGHTWMLQWAKRQGDVLVVAINDDLSAWRHRPGGYVMPLAERVAILSALDCVDWIVPFSDDTACAVLKALDRPVVVKGPEYAMQDFPERRSSREVLCAPSSPFSRHTTDIVKEVKGA